MNQMTMEKGWSARPALRRIRSLAEEGLVRLALRGVDQVGARPRVSGVPFIENLGTMTLGDDLELQSRPVRSHLVTGLHGALHIGHRVSIGSGAAIAAEAGIEIGDGARLGPLVMILDTDYHVAGDRTAPAAAEPIVIGAGAWLGERVTVLRGARIGRAARVEAGSVVSGVVADGAHVAGVPALPVRPEGSGPSRAPDLPTEADLLPRILRVAADVFALPHLPTPEDGPATIPVWDSLGALRLLVSLEDELALRLPPGALAGVRDFAAIRDLVGRVRPPRADWKAP